MQDENKIFGLMAQAEDIQKHAISLQSTAESVVKNVRTTAEDAFKTLPDAVRNAVSEAAKNLIASEAEKAARGLLEASNEAKAASIALRRTGLMQGVFLLAVAIVTAVIGLGAMNFIGKSRIADLAELKAQIAQEQATLTELQSKTWKVELIKYDDGSRWIVLPKGVKYVETGTMKDGSEREAVHIKP